MNITTHLCGRGPKPERKIGLTITERRRQVIYWLARGKENAEIGQIMGISQWTVKGHVEAILSVYKAPNRMSAVVKAIAVGDLSLDELMKDFS